MARPVLGILTLYLNDQKLLEERPIYQRMIVAGKRLGMDVMVFTPADVDYEGNRINAMYYDPSSKAWSRRWSSFPHLIFDRCRIQNSPRFEQLKKFRSRYGHLGFLNRPLRNKWTIYKTLQSQPRFQNKQPQTVLYASHRDLADMLKKHPLVFLKPINGTGGRGILRIERLAGGMYSIQGRDQSRKIIRPQKVGAGGLQSRLSSWSLGGGRYIVQQGIQLKLPSGRVHDYRMLVQKNGRGEWEPTGCAGRIGAAGSITSNLHGGGKAAKMEELLDSWIDEGLQASEVRLEAEQFSIEVAEYLERQYGRLCELALDLAIDRQGGIWLLEVNPKPAREVFKQSGDIDTYDRAIVKPLEYALYLYNRRAQRKSGGRTTGSRTQGQPSRRLRQGRQARRRRPDEGKPSGRPAERPYGTRRKRQGGQPLCPEEAFGKRRIRQNDAAARPGSGRVPEAQTHPARQASGRRPAGGPVRPTDSGA
ncbi:YheC/YheD family protein [Paenibacillus sp. P22]|uniref:YheC/YheD family endospore coat-associated protein n=1 Tax=Paenibacillus sp. P22 TaxID=483908 RepID=UPI0009FA187B